MRPLEEKDFKYVSLSHLNFMKWDGVHYIQVETMQEKTKRLSEEKRLERKKKLERIYG